MLRTARIAVLAALWAAPGRSTRAQHAESPVQVHVDVHVPGPALAVPVSPEPPRRHRRRHREDAPPPAAWHDRGAPAHDGFHVPPDRVPGRGSCRIWYDDLPPDRQPPPMSCERAHQIARRHGGRVIWAGSDRAHHDGHVASASYGNVDFRGVPPDRLPPPGSCRVWLEGVPPDRQPPPGPCDRAERDARRTGGRLLYMPGS